MADARPAAAPPPAAVFGERTGAEYTVGRRVGRPGAEARGVFATADGAWAFKWVPDDGVPADYWLNAAEQHRHRDTLGRHAAAVHEVVRTAPGGGGGRAGVVMPFVPGPTLDDLFHDWFGPDDARHAPLPVILRTLAAVYAAQAGIEAAGDNGQSFVNSDAKPANFIVTSGPGPAPCVAAIDSTSILARWVRDEYGQVATPQPLVRGTPGYLRPERLADPAVRFDAEDARYQTAVMCFEGCHGGRHPTLPGKGAAGYDPDDHAARGVFPKYTAGVPVPRYPHVLPRGLDDLLGRALVGRAPRPAPAEFRRALVAWAAELERPPPPQAPPEPGRARRLLRAVVAALSRPVAARYRAAADWAGAVLGLLARRVRDVFDAPVFAVLVVLAAACVWRFTFRHAADPPAPPPRRQDPPPLPPLPPVDGFPDGLAGAFKTKP